MEKYLKDYYTYSHITESIIRSVKTKLQQKQNFFLKSRNSF